jgi:hypothetical protein
MSLVSNNQHGATYEFGFQAADAPAIAGFVARTADLKYEPEVDAVATDGEGHADSVTTSKPSKRKITATFTGYITDQFDPVSLPEGFNFNARFYLIKNISEPRQKGQYVEVSIEALSLAGVEN